MKSRKLTFLFAAALMMALTYVTPAQAGGKTIWENPENPCNKVSLTGNVRYRYETTSHNKNDGSSTDSNDQDRQRIRVRLGFKIMTGGGVTAEARMTTDGGIDSQNETLEGMPSASSARYDLNVDRANVKWKHGSGLWLIGGKFGNPAKQLSGAWWNGNNSVEGLGLGYTAAVGDGKIKFVVAQLIIDEKGYLNEGDEKAILAGLHWSGAVGDIKIDAAFTNLNIDYTVASPGTVDDKAYSLIVLGAKMGAISGGIEYFTSDDKDKDLTGGESTDNNGLVIHVRYKINSMLGIRLYQFDMGDDSAPLPQTDFTEKSNFTGTRIQLDVKAAGMTMDFRYLTQKRKNDAAAYTPDYFASGDKATRIQANFIVGF